ncbi:MAG: tetraacyldisaccharide 4'-kinase [Bacteroidota bacterium]
MKTLRFILFPLGLLFIAITEIRNFLYNSKIIRPSKFDVPVISIGNLSVGGTGKTPHSDYLVALLQSQYRIALLSRGYGRKTKEFLELTTETNARDCGDEPMMLKKRHPDISVNVEANRVKGIIHIIQNHPDTDVVLLDDAYQHRAVKPGFSILLTEAADPFFTDFILPVGNLRELRKNANRCDVVVFTKCNGLDNEMKEFLLKSVKRYTPAPVFFSSYRYLPLKQVFGDGTADAKGKKVFLLTGIANPSPLKKYYEEQSVLMMHLVFRDHYYFKEIDIRTIEKLFATFGSDCLIVTTEKDAVRLLSLKPELRERLQKLPLYFQPVEVEMGNSEHFNQLVKNYVATATANYRSPQN